MSRYYREYKGEKIEVESHTCGACEHYDIDKTHCSSFNATYPIYDSCKNRYEESSDVHSY